MSATKPGDRALLLAIASADPPGVTRADLIRFGFSAEGLDMRLWMLEKAGAAECAGDLWIPSRPSIEPAAGIASGW